MYALFWRGARLVYLADNRYAVLGLPLHAVLERGSNHTCTMGIEGRRIGAILGRVFHRTQSL